MIFMTVEIQILTLLVIELLPRRHNLAAKFIGNKGLDFKT